MTSFKRAVADQVETLLNVRIAAPHRLGEAYEASQIHRVIDAFGIDAVFDVGANEGQYRRFLRERVRFDGEIISFEPIPALADQLRRDAQGDTRWHVSALALDETPGDAELHLARDSQFSSLRLPSPDGAMFFANGAMESEPVRVETSTLAIELKRWRDRLGFSRPYLKLDTQGHDLSVASGAGEAIKAFSAVQTEAALLPLYSGAPTLSETLAFFSERGFDPCAFAPNNEGHFPRLIETDVILVNREAARRMERQE